MPLLTADQIRAAEDRKYEVVPVPEWGGEVRIRALTAAERDDFEKTTVVFTGRKPEMNFTNIRARFLVRVIVGEDDKPLFDLADIAVLGRKSSRAVQRVYEAARRLNGMDDDAAEDAAKNS